MAPNSHGWMTARRPERGGRRSGGHWWRTSTAAGCGSGVSSGAPLRSRRWTRSRRAVTWLLMCERLVCRPWSPCQVMAGAIAASGGPGQRGARRAGAGVVGLELVDVLGERARGLDAVLQALEQARLAGEAIELAREVAGVEAVEERALDLVAHCLAQAAEARGDERH